jgi:hypothetical protein
MKNYTFNSLSLHVSSINILKLLVDAAAYSEHGVLIKCAM